MEEAKQTDWNKVTYEAVLKTNQDYNELWKNIYADSTNPTSQKVINLIDEQVKKLLKLKEGYETGNISFFESEN